MTTELFNGNRTYSIYSELAFAYASGVEQDEGGFIRSSPVDLGYASLYSKSEYIFSQGTKPNDFSYWYWLSEHLDYDNLTDHFDNLGCYEDGTYNIYLTEDSDLVFLDAGNDGVKVEAGSWASWGGDDVIFGGSGENTLYIEEADASKISFLTDTTSDGFKVITVSHDDYQGTIKLVDFDNLSIAGYLDWSNAVDIDLNNVAPIAYDLNHQSKFELSGNTHGDPDLWLMTVSYATKDGIASTSITATEGISGYAQNLVTELNTKLPSNFSASYLGRENGTHSFILESTEFFSATVEVQQLHPNSNDLTFNIIEQPLSIDSSTNEDEVLTSNLPVAFDANDDVLNYSIVADPSHGTILLNSDGWYTYTPDPNYFGEDAFTYIVNDGALNSNEATAKLYVNPVNDPAIFGDFSVEGELYPNRTIWIELDHYSDLEGVDTWENYSDQYVAIRTIKIDGDGNRAEGSFGAGELKQVHLQDEDIGSSLYVQATLTDLNGSTEYSDEILLGVVEAINPIQADPQGLVLYPNTTKSSLLYGGTIKIAKSQLTFTLVILNQLMETLLLI
jgi:hypothetical protein